MPKPNYLKLFLIFILFSAISAKCSSCKNSKKEQLRDINVSVTLSKDIIYIEDRNTKITLNIKSEEQIASEFNYKCVSWSVLDGLGKLVNESGDPIHPGHMLKYGDNELYYQPIAGSEGRHVLELVVSDEEGKIEKKKQIDITVKDHRSVDFQVQLQPDKPTAFAHQQAKLVVDIASTEEKASGLTYKIKSISSNKEGTSFSSSEVNNIVSDYPLKHGINALYYNPNKQIGTHNIKLVVINEKGDIRTATATLTIIDVDFQIEMTPEEPTVFVHQQAKLIVDISSIEDEASELSYKIKLISSNKEGASFSSSEINNIGSDYPLKYGVNTLYYNPDKQTGKHDIRLVVTNSNGTSKTITASLEVINTEFQVQFKPEKPSIFLHQQEAKFIIDISSPQEEASKLTYKIKSISSSIEGTTFLTSEGDDVPASYALKYGKNILKYDCNRQVGKHDLRLVIINSKGDIKTATATLNIIDVDFQVQLKPEKPSIFLHQQGKLIIDISSSQEEASKLSYKIKSISSSIEGTTFLTPEGDDVPVSYALKYGKNTLNYDCNRQIGKHDIKLVVINSNGASKTVTTSLEISKVDFQIQLHSKKPSIFLHQQEAKFIIDISSSQEEAKELTYKIKEITSNKEGTIFSMLEGDDILAGHILHYGKNVLSYNPNTEPGKHDIKLVVTNSNGASRIATATLEVVDVDFQAQIKPEKPTVFLHQQAKLIVDISSPQEEASKLAYSIKEINSNRPGTSFSTLEGDDINTGYTLKYGKNTLYYSAAKQIGIHHIKLTISNSNGSSTTVTTSTNIVDVDLEVQLKLERSTVFLHHQPKFILDISSPQEEAKELTYKIKEISSDRQGISFSTTGGGNISVGYVLKYGENILCYNPLKQIGSHDIKLTVLNSNDNEKLVTASINVIDADFFSQVKISEVLKSSEKTLELVINVGSSSATDEDRWQIASWKIEGGIVGKLQDAASQELKVKNIPIQSAENRFVLALEKKVEFTNLPQLTVVIKQPDGIEKPFIFDLSNYILADLVNNIKLMEAEMVSASKKYVMGEKFAEEKFNRAISQLQTIKNNLNTLMSSGSINRDQLEDAIIKVDEIFSYSKTVVMDKAIYNKFGRGINEKDEYGRTPLIEAMDKNDEKAIDLVLTHPNVDLKIGHTISSKNNNVVYSALHYAIIRRSNDVTIPKKLLKAGSKVDDRVLISKEALLMPPYKSEEPYRENSEFEKSRTLCEYGLTVEEYNKKIRQYNDNLAKNTVVKSEWSPRYMLPNQDYKGDTPLHTATQEKLLEPVKLLISEGADINSKNGYWQTPLHVAISAAQPTNDTKAVALVKYLIENGADVNAVDLNDNNPLHYAVCVGNEEIVKLLLEVEVIFNSKNRLYGKNKFGDKIDNEGLDPSVIAFRKHRFSIIFNLLKNKFCNSLEESEKSLFECKFYDFRQESFMPNKSRKKLSINSDPEKEQLGPKIQEVD